MAACLTRRMIPEMDSIMPFAIKYHAEEELFLVFGYVIHQRPLPVSFIIKWIKRYPSLTFAPLKAYPPDDECRLAAELEPFGGQIITGIILSANDTRMAALVAIGKLAQTVGWLKINQYIELLMLTAFSVRSSSLVQEVLVLNDSRIQYFPDTDTAATLYAHKHALGFAFDRAEEAADECPCDGEGRPRKKQRAAPSHTKLTFASDYLEQGHIIATIRIDARTAVRLYSHVRLQAASRPENQWIEAPIMDGIVAQALKAELKIHLLHPVPLRWR